MDTSMSGWFNAQEKEKENRERIKKIEEEIKDKRTFELGERVWLRTGPIIPHEMEQYFEACLTPVRIHGRSFLYGDYKVLRSDGTIERVLKSDLIKIDEDADEVA